MDWWEDWWEKLKLSHQLLAGGIMGKNPQMVGAALNFSTYFGGNSSSSKKGSGGSSGGGSAKPPAMGYERSMSEYLAEVARLMGMGMDEGTARAVAGGGGGGGGGGGAYINTAARDAALANAASTYATAAATFDGSPEEYKKISAAEKASGTEGAENATAGMEQAYKAALASRAMERAALGIEDAADVGIDTVENERKIAGENIERDSARRDTRVQGHLDNALKFNTDLKAVVELEGKEMQKQITDYYAGQLAQIASRRGGGGGGGGRSGGSSSRSLTPNQLWNAARDLQNDDLRRLNAMYTPGYNQQALKNVGTQYPNASLSQQLSLSKYLYPNQYSRP